MEDDANSHSLHKLEVQFDLHLHPSKAQDIMEGVREQLNLLLLRYSEDLEGVLLSYCRERLVSKQAGLHPYFPYLHVKVRADVVLFRPLVGSMLVGRVNKVGDDYLGLLLLGVFNASIGAEDIRSGFRRDAQSQSWVDKHDRSHQISEGSLVRFRVKAVLDQVSMFSMSGSLMEAGTGLLGHPSTILQDAADAGVKEKKRRKRQKGHTGDAAPSAAHPTQAAAGGGQHAAAAAARNNSSEKHKKKKKRKRHEEEMQQQQQQQQQLPNGGPACAPAAVAAGKADGANGHVKKKKHKSKHKD